MRLMAMILLTTTAILALTVVDGVAQEPLRIRCQWTKPTTGSDPVLYQVQFRDVDGGLDTTYVVPAQPGDVQEFVVTDGQYARRYEARVRALDAEGDEGPWSPWSLVYSFEVDDPEP